MKGVRIKATAAAVSAAAGILAGILGSWLTGRWLWGVAAGVLFLIAVTAAAEVIKVRAEEDGRPDEGQGEGDHPPHQVSTSIAVGAVAGNFSARNSVIAGGNVNQSRVTNVTQKNPLALLAVICLGSLLAYAAGTVLLGREPGGLFHTGSPATGGPGWPATSTSGSATRAASGGSSLAVHYHLAATYEETNSQGDSITQTVSFGSPMALTELPEVARASQHACFGESPSPPLPRDLVIPFLIVSTLNSGLPVQAAVYLNIDDFNDDTGNDAGGLMASGGSPEVIGEYGSKFGCDFDTAPGTAAIAAGKPTIPLSRPGKAVTFNGWIIFSDAISPDYLDGNTAALGRTYAELDFADSQGTEIDNIQAIGPGICNGMTINSISGPGNVDTDSPPFLRMGGGPGASWEGCSGRFSGSP